MRIPARLTLALAFCLGPACAQALSFVAEPPWLASHGTYSNRDVTLRRFRRDSASQGNW